MTVLEAEVPVHWLSYPPHLYTVLHTYRVKRHQSVFNYQLHSWNVLLTSWNTTSCYTRQLTVTRSLETLPRLAVSRGSNVQCWCPRGKSLSSRILEDQSTSPCPCTLRPCPLTTSPSPCPRALSFCPCPGQHYWYFDCLEGLGLRLEGYYLGLGLNLAFTVLVPSLAMTSLYVLIRGSIRETVLTALVTRRASGLKISAPITPHGVYFPFTAVPSAVWEGHGGMVLNSIMERASQGENWLTRVSCNDGR